MILEIVVHVIHQQLSEFLVLLLLKVLRLHVMGLPTVRPMMFPLCLLVARIVSLELSHSLFLLLLF